MVVIQLREDIDRFVILADASCVDHFSKDGNKVIRHYPRGGITTQFEDKEEKLLETFKKTKTWPFPVLTKVSNFFY